MSENVDVDIKRCRSLQRSTALAHPPRLTGSIPAHDLYVSKYVEFIRQYFN